MCFLFPVAADLVDDHGNKPDHKPLGSNACVSNGYGFPSSCLFSIGFVSG